MSDSETVEQTKKQSAIDFRFSDTTSGVHVIKFKVKNAEELQAFSVLDYLDKAITEVEADSSCKMIIFRGLGISSYDTPHDLPDINLYMKREELLNRIRKLAVFSIALIDGICTGLHFELMLLADYSLATETSIFSIPELARGYLPGVSTFRLAQQIGIKSASRLMLQGKKFTAEQALRYELIDATCQIEELDSRLTKMSTEFTSGMIAKQLCRRLLDESFYTSYEDSLGHFMAAQHRCFSKLEY